MMLEAAVLCLAMNIYHEARGESLAGQMGVANSVLNRVDDPRFPNDVCGVVYQARYSSWDKVNPIRNKCSYSWYCDGKSDTPLDDRAFLEATLLSKHMLEIGYPDLTGGATHYHADYVQPYWAETLSYTVKIDQHIYYR